MGGGNANSSSSDAALADWAHQRRPAMAVLARRASVARSGQPDRSMVLHRMTLTGLGRMPHIGSREVHVSAVKLIRDWIAGLRDK
jgi:hypothetical protein